MTGYARREGRHGRDSWIWEIKSVNGRSLELRSRMPTGTDHLEIQVRAAAAERLKRGNIAVTLTFARRPATARLTVNRELLDQAIGLMAELEGRIDAAPPRLDGLLSIKGVIEAVDEADEDAGGEERDAALLESFRAALDLLVAGRRAEGARLREVLVVRLAEIEQHVAAAAACAAAQPAAIRDRLHAQLEALLGTLAQIGPERLAQEAALLAAKADIREEIDRLTAHVGAARAMLAEGGAVGRRLDFLCQEFNREANTLCSKSGDIELTRIGLALKSAIEQLREQIQNIE
ncbi:MAG: YicC family protein [Alphaproteobacteria bacterium]|nr:YicC family protein [Alphaproteobacteria bacterium]